MIHNTERYGPLLFLSVSFTLFSTLFRPFCLPFIFFNPVVIYCIIIICCLLTTNNSNILSIHTTVIISYKMLLKTRTNRLSFFFFSKPFFEGILGNDAFASSPKETSKKRKEKNKCLHKGRMRIQRGNSILCINSQRETVSKVLGLSLTGMKKDYPTNLSLLLMQSFS